MNGKPWTEAEDAILRNNWNSVLPCTMWGIPGRSPHAIRNRARHLGLGSKIVDYGAMYPQINERAEAILALLAKEGPMPSTEIQKQLKISESQHRRAHERIRGEIYIFAWEMGSRGGEWPIWALGDAPDAKRPPKGDAHEYQKRYREKHKRPSRAKPKEDAKPVFVPPGKADLASSWLFNPC